MPRQTLNSSTIKLITCCAVAVIIVFIIVMGVVSIKRRNESDEVALAKINARVQLSKDNIEREANREKTAQALGTQIGEIAKSGIDMAGKIISEDNTGDFGTINQSVLPLATEIEENKQPDLLDLSDDIPEEKIATEVEDTEKTATEVEDKEKPINDLLDLSKPKQTLTGGATKKRKCGTKKATTKKTSAKKNKK